MPLRLCVKIFRQGLFSLRQDSFAVLSIAPYDSDRWIYLVRVGQNADQNEREIWSMYARLSVRWGFLKVVLQLLAMTRKSPKCEWRAIRKLSSV